MQKLSHFDRNCLEGQMCAKDLNIVLDLGACALQSPDYYQG